jgi:hypothetical protein
MILSEVGLFRQVAQQSLSLTRICCNVPSCLRPVAFLPAARRTRFRTTAGVIRWSQFKWAVELVRRCDFHLQFL